MSDDARSRAAEAAAASQQVDLFSESTDRLQQFCQGVSVGSCQELVCRGMTPDECE